LLFTFSLFPFVFFLCGCGPGRPASGDVDWPVGDFMLTERSGRTVSRQDLLGKTWVAAFIFTRCGGPCPQVTANMARLQAQLAADDGVLLVTFTVDPRHDTALVLRAYAARYGADPKRWLFLTGDRNTMYSLIETSFKSVAQQTAGPARIPGNEFVHSTRLFVVDRRAHVRAFFDGREVDDDDGGKPINELPKVRQKVAELEREEGTIRGEDLPSVNALLNLISAVLLAAGYAAIRRRYVRLHVACMLTALAVSVLFLASYLYYHGVVRHWQSTPFPGTGWVKAAYLAVLRTHELLAPVVAALALYTAYLGLTGRFVRHVRLARWTWPLWLYVCVTGIVVYWMLYRLYPSGAEVIQ